MLTHPAPRAQVLSEELSARGIAVVGWPMTAIEEAPGLDWSALSSDLAQCRWVLFPSPGAIDVTMSALLRAGRAWPPGVSIGLVGPGSVEALEAWRARLVGLDRVDLVSPVAAPYDPDALLSRPEFQPPLDVGIAVLRRADGRDDWLQTLAARGARLQAWTVYSARDRVPPPGAADWLAARAAAGHRILWAIASADVGRRLARFVDDLPVAPWCRAQRVLTQHPRIGDALRAQGWQDVVCHAPGGAGLQAAIESSEDSQR